MGVYHNYQLAFAGSFQESGPSSSDWRSSFPAWFQAIPPERVGLDGEYDHEGLKKRVEAKFKKYFSADALAQLTVSQRGRVVILHGHVENQSIVERLIELAHGVEGCIRVETDWVTYGAQVLAAA